MRVDNFDHIVSREWPAILNFINASMRDRYVAEDLTLECFWRASQGWPGFRGDCSVRTWLRQIAMNVIRNFLRSQKAQLVWRAASIDEVPEAFLLEHAPLSPEAVAILRESVTRIWAAADGISTKQRVAMRLRFNADLELAEIAAAMGITEGSVKVHLSRAVQSVRSTLQGHQQFDLKPGSR